MRTLVLLLVACVLGACVLGACVLVGPSAHAADAPAGDDGLALAISAYRTALDTQDAAERRDAFAQAQRQFERAVESGVGHNADLFTNLGNAALGAEDVGPAMWAYRAALRLDPTNARAHANIAHIREQLPTWVPKPSTEGVLDTFFFWRRTMTPATRAWVGALCMFLAVLLIGGWLVGGIRWMRWLALLPLFVWTLLVVVPAMESLGETNAGVVTARDAILRTADAAGAPARFVVPLPGGTEVTILEPRDEWMRVRLADGRDGWLRKSQLRVIP